MLRLRVLSSLAGVATLSLLVTACGGGGSSLPSAATTPAYPTSGIPSALQIKNWNEGALRGATFVAPITRGMLSANVQVHQQNAQALEEYAREVTDPKSANFHHWLTPKEIGERFGASKADYQKAADYFASQGLVVGAWPQRMLLTVSGDQSKMARAFGTAFGLYQRDGQTFAAPRTTPHFLNAIPVDAVGKLVGYRAAHSYLMNPPRAGAAFGIGYSPQLVRAAFDLNNAYAHGFDGSGVSIAVIGTGPIDTAGGNAGADCSTNGNPNGTQGDADLNALKSLYNHIAVANVYEQCVTANGVAAGLAVSGIPTASPGPTPLPNTTPAPLPNGFTYSNAFQTPPPVTGSCTDVLPACNPEDGEAQLDVQQAAALAPGATVNFYLAYNAADCYTFYPNPCASTGYNAAAPEIGIVEADAEIQQVIADNTADIITMSYGGGELQQFPNGASDYQSSFYHLEFAELAVEGIAAFASSGDSGSAECLGSTGYLPQVCVSYPSGDPYVTSVGGVSAYISSLGALQAPLLAWGISTSDVNGYGGNSATGGGVSTFMPTPAWQSAALGSSAGAFRTQPDVSMIGDPNTGVTFFVDSRFSGGAGDIGGTSVAAPEMAAVWSLVLSACKQNAGHGMCPASGSGHYWRLGNASPYFYSIYANASVPTSPTGSGATGAPSLAYHDVFYDVLYGSNEMESNGGLPSAPVPGANAMAGYDQTTGVGLPYAGHLIQAISGVTVP